MSVYSPDQPPPDTIPAKEAAKLLNTHLSTVHRAVNTGKLRGWRLLGRVYVSRAELLELWQRIPPKPTAAQARAAGNLPATRRELAQRAAYVDQELRKLGIRK